MEHAHGQPTFMGFEPHGHCFLWQPDLIALHTVSDFVTGLSYYLIPVAIFYFVRKRSDVPFPAMFLLFALFIVSCGTTHLMAIWTIWTPDYWLEGWVKAATAFFSLVTALLLFPLLPKAMLIPSPAQLEAAKAELQRHKDHLEDLVAERTSELQTANARLEAEIAERKSAEDALRESEQQLRGSREFLAQIVDNIPDPVFVKDENHRYVLANTALCVLAGKPRGEVVGKTDHDFLPERQAQLFISRDKFVLETGEMDITEEQFTDPSGRPLALLTKKTRYVDAGQKKYVVGVIRDVTERKRMQEIMVQTEKMMSVGGLAAGMAHEINNPLSAVLQSIQVVQNRLSKDSPANLAAAEAAGCPFEAIKAFLGAREVNSLLQGVRDAGARAAKIVSSMLEFSRKTESNRALVDLNGLLDKAVELCANDYDLKKKYDFRKIAIERDFDQGMPLVPCTATQIEQVVMNLLRNAAQAMAENAGQASPPRIALRTTIEEGMARIEVQDNGPGMDEAVRKRIFEPFYTTKGPGQGTGLGLSVSYFIITENHRGSIEVQSRPGEGTRFIIRLPLSEEGHAG
ncbi:ATP-binding protein [Fundidesulfovibrio terrae]|uniref:ATP-binding protein n=1 Tax=Fundidesulfovibrio terrae TaxID=2922866 RepID=UPI001FAFA8B2|nr:ATP-binding protein [Fundidesulfovibrio terrae]